MSDPSLQIRDAAADDLAAVVGMLADDPLGAAREVATDPVAEPYVRAFDAIQASPNDRLLVAIAGDTVVGCLQLTLIPGLSRTGMTRAQIESVRVAGERRGTGIGEALVDFAVAEARRAGAGLVQLTTDKSRPDALRFYERVGFTASHVGLKLAL